MKERIKKAVKAVGNELIRERILKSLVLEYWKNEGLDDGLSVADIDPKTAGMLYTTTEDDEHDIEVFLDLIELECILQFDGKVVFTEHYDDVESFIASNLDSASWECYYRWAIDKLSEEGLV